jgi:hypothetical protein
LSRFLWVILPEVTPGSDLFASALVVHDPLTVCGLSKLVPRLNLSSANPASHILALLAILADKFLFVLHGKRFPSLDLLCLTFNLRQSILNWIQLLSS